MDGLGFIRKPYKGRPTRSLEPHDLRPLLLVADRDRPLCDHLKDHFRGEEVGILRVDSGEACLDVLQNTDVSVVIVDHQLSDMLGLQLLSRIKEVDPDVEVIFTTVGHSPELEIQARQQGILYYFVRSDEYESLDKFIHNILWKKGQRGALIQGRYEGRHRALNMGEPYGKHTLA